MGLVRQAFTPLAQRHELVLDQAVTPKGPGGREHGAAVGGCPLLVNRALRVSRFPTSSEPAHAIDRASLRRRKSKTTKGGENDREVETIRGRFVHGVEWRKWKYAASPQSARVRSPQLQLRLRRPTAGANLLHHLGDSPYPD